MHDRADLYIGGLWVPASGGERLQVINPANEEIIGSVPMGTAEDVDAAVGSARAAFDQWSVSSIEQRIEFLNALAEAFKQRSEELAQMVTAEVGTPIGYSRMAMIGTPTVVLKSYARMLADFEFEQEVRNSLIIREPVGVCGMITPWNFPLHQIIGKVAPALAAGCTMVLKPSKEAPLNAFLLADMIDEVGLPAGVFNLVMGHGAEVGEAIASHPEVDLVTFTGSTGAGARVSELAAPSIKRVTLELGGKSANIILEDADIEAAAKTAIGACFQNSGQTCSALTRLLIPSSARDEVVDLISTRLQRYSVGDPLDESTRCGPLVSARQQASVSAHIAKAIEQGAILIAGGEGMPAGLERGFFVKPTAFADVTPKMDLFHEEVFGPVLGITCYESEDEAIALANDSEYGLSGGVWSADPARAEAVARRLRTGQVSINGGAFNIYAPFGGYKRSGNGRELGVHGLEEYLELKSLQR